MVNEKCTALPTESESTPQHNKKNYISTSLPKQGFRVTPPWRLNKMLQVSTFEFSCRHCRNSMLGRYSLQLRVTGAIDHDLLRNVLPELLQDVDLQKGIYLCFMHDGAPPHFIIAVQEFLNNVFLAECLRRDGPTAWPARSPHFNPLDFYLWRHLKSAVYATEVHHRLAPNKERISDDSSCTWNFPESQATTVKTCNIMRWRSTWTPLPL